MKQSKPDARSSINGADGQPTEPGAPPRHFLNELRARLDATTRPVLGLTEPTLCGYASRRIHETAGDDTRTLSPERILRERADFTTAQLRTGGNGQAVYLPLLWQYDLLHAVEQLPEHRHRAHHDALHSFFRRDEATATLLEHQAYLQEHGGWMKLLWHSYHPFYGDADYYAVSGQSDPNEPLRWVDGAFSAFPEDRMSKSEQYAALELLVESIETGDPGTNAVYRSFHRKLDRIADFALTLAARGTGAMFRPYHEHHPGNYWWWACKNLAAEAAAGQALYRRLWLATRRYLEAKGVHNLLNVYAPDLTEHFEEIDSREKFLAHYRCGMPDPKRIDVLSMTGYLHKLTTAADRREEAAILARCRNDVERRHHELNQLKALRFARLLQLTTWLREAYPDHYVGVSETGYDYGAYATPLEDNAACQCFWSDYALPKMEELAQEQLPHFICFWRNDVHAGKAQAAHPFASDNPVFNQECTAIGAAFTSQLTDLSPPLA